MKKCPFCAEEIQDEAIKCRYCGEFLDNVRVRKPGTKWYFSSSSVVIALLCVGPLAMPLVWFNPFYKKSSKIIITAIVSVITGLITWLMIKLIPQILDHYSQLRDVMEQLK